METRYGKLGSSRNGTRTSIGIWKCSTRSGRNAASAANIVKGCVTMNDNNFFSMDKLVEFGMGMAVANQMVGSMNQSLSQMMVPGAGKAMPNNTDLIYYVIMDRKSVGPFSLTELSRLISEKKVLKETYVWKPGMQQWDLAENISEILKIVALTPPPIPKDIDNR